MKRQRPFLALLYVLLCFILANQIGAAVPSLRFLPVVANGQFQPSVIVLIESDTTFISADYDETSGRVFVNYIDRAHGNRLHVTELVGDTLHELPVPTALAAVAATLAARASPGPAFVPDTAKDADSAMFMRDGVQWLFVSSRDADDPAGPFKLRLARFRP